MPRKSREEKLAILEDVTIRSQIPKKILPLIEQLVCEQCVETNAALTLRMTLLELRLKELERWLGLADPQPHEGDNPWKYYDPNSKLDEHELQDAGAEPDSPDQDRDDEIPF